MKFNEKLIELRKKEGLSQEELGYKLNVTRQTVSKWELGITTPEMDKLSELSQIFNVSVDKLINDSEISFDSNVNPINSKIEDQPIQEKRTNKTKTILLIILAIIVGIIIAKAILGMLGLSLFKKAANQVMDMGAGFINNAMAAGQNNNSNVLGEEILNAATGIINNTINEMQNNSDIMNTEDMLNELASNFNQMTGILENNIDSSLNDKISDTKNEISVKGFNGHIELFAGTSSPSFVVQMLDNIITSNKTKDRKISVKYNKTETQVEDEIRSIKQTINKMKMMEELEVICEYDTQGYIYKVIIEKI